MCAHFVERITFFVLLHEDKALVRIAQSVWRIIKIKHHLIILQVEDEVADHLKVILGRRAHLIEPILALELVCHFENALVLCSLQLLSCLKINAWRHIR